MIIAVCFSIVSILFFILRMIVLERGPFKPKFEDKLFEVGRCILTISVDGDSDHTRTLQGRVYENGWTTDIQTVYENFQYDKSSFVETDEGILIPKCKIKRITKTFIPYTITQKVVKHA